MPNPAVEDYIKNIYKLQHGSTAVTTSALASTMRIADASVTDMAKKLAERGFVRYRRYRGVALTPAGRRMAVRTIRRHRLWEMFLQRYLGFAWDEIHEQAELLEHVTSEELERRLDALLGFPTADPHGDPIPDAGGMVPTLPVIALAHCGPGQSLRVSRVKDESPKLLKRAAAIGLVPGRRIAVIGVAHDGSLTTKIGRRRRLIRREIAAAVFVETL
ncbi:MAG: metal-dependent transcriptional regulator [Bacteroidota bacterium]